MTTANMATGGAAMAGKAIMGAAAGKGERFSHTGCISVVYDPAYKA